LRSKAPPNDADVFIPFARLPQDAAGVSRPRHQMWAVIVARLDDNSRTVVTRLRVAHHGRDAADLAMR
jgi:hypothetical protein